jgi:hypothetical protein
MNETYWTMLLRLLCENIMLGSRDIMGIIHHIGIGINGVGVVEWDDGKNMTYE